MMAERRSAVANTWVLGMGSTEKEHEKTLWQDGPPVQYPDDGSFYMDYMIPKFIEMYT